MVQKPKKEEKKKKTAPRKGFKKRPNVHKKLYKGRLVQNRLWRSEKTRKFRKFTGKAQKSSGARKGSKAYKNANPRKKVQGKQTRRGAMRPGAQKKRRSCQHPILFASWERSHIFRCNFMVFPFFPPALQKLRGLKRATLHSYLLSARSHFGSSNSWLKTRLKLKLKSGAFPPAAPLTPWYGPSWPLSDNGVGMATRLRARH